MVGIELIPSARRMMKSLRDMGYDFSQAVADVVDNSVAAGASEVQIDAEFDGDDSWVRIIDNGAGMRPDTLVEALRYGAEREYDDDDLGKFGFGLKTASISQCRKVSVASRWNPKRADIRAYAWDLDHIERSNKWEVLPISRTPQLFRPLDDGPGTVVLWEGLDRILGYKHPYGEAARTRFAQLCRELEQHLSMVFHRFLSGQLCRRLRIVLNNNEVQAWDPFCRSETRTDRWEPFYLTVDEEGAKGSIRVEPFVLPHQSDFSSPSAFKNAAGPSGWNQQQGLYVYRANRMIQSGGWSRLRTPDEHTKLARIAVSFSPSLDEAFKVNVAKMRVQIPGSVREELKEFAAKLAKAARKAYDRKEKRSAGIIDPSPRIVVPARGGEAPHASGRRESGKAYNVPARAMTLEEWRSATLRVATAREKPYVRAAIARLEDGKE